MSRFATIPAGQITGESMDGFNLPSAVHSMENILGRSSRIVSVDVIRRINRIVIQNLSLGLLYTARRACVSIILVSGENYGKKVWDEYSLLQGGEREGGMCLFERKRSKRKKSLERVQ